MELQAAATDANEVLRRALELDRAGQWDQAVALYEAILEREPEHLDARLAYGRSLNKRALPGAEGHLRKALEIGSDRSDVHTLLGRSQAKLGRLVEAEETFRQALALDPASLGSLIGLAEALERQGKIDEAYLAFRRSSRTSRRPTAPWSDSSAGR